MIDKTKLIKSKKPDKKEILITIRINKPMSNFLKDNKYSPAKVFCEALRELGFQPKDI